MVSAAVGIANHVEPVDGHPLAIVRRGQQPIDEPFVRGRRMIGREGVDIGQRGGSPVRSKFSRRSSVRGSASGEGRRPCSSCMAAMKESIGLRTQGDCFPAGTRGRLRAAVGPMAFELRPFVDPLTHRAIAWEVSRGRLEFGGGIISSGSVLLARSISGLLAARRAQSPF